jgi:hypothetical protein
MIPSGRVGYLKEPLIHENLKGVGAFLDRHIRYARLEAEEIVSRSPSAGGGALRQPPRAWLRRWIKESVWYRLRHRPAIRFFWLYVVRGGWRDGVQGRVYCQLIAAYEAMIDAYVLEFQLLRRLGSRAESGPR